jgi:hypothetical protein
MFAWMRRLLPEELVAIFWANALWRRSVATPVWLVNIETSLLILGFPIF